MLGVRENVIPAGDVSPARSAVVRRVGLDLRHEIVFVLGHDWLLAPFAGDRQSHAGIPLIGRWS
jgi:hypothetical protein